MTGKIQCSPTRRPLQVTPVLRARDGAGLRERESVSVRLARVGRTRSLHRTEVGCTGCCAPRGRQPRRRGVVGKVKPPPRTPAGPACSGEPRLMPSFSTLLLLVETRSRVDVVPRRPTVRPPEQEFVESLSRAAEAGDFPGVRPDDTVSGSLAESSAGGITVGLAVPNLTCRRRWLLVSYEPGHDHGTPVLQSAGQQMPCSTAQVGAYDGPSNDNELWVSGIDAGPSLCAEWVAGWLGRAAAATSSYST